MSGVPGIRHLHDFVNRSTVLHLVVHRSLSCIVPRCCSLRSSVWIHSITRMALLLFDSRRDLLYGHWLWALCDRFWMLLNLLLWLLGQLWLLGRLLLCLLRRLLRLCLRYRR